MLRAAWHGSMRAPMTASAKPGRCTTPMRLPPPPPGRTGGPARHTARRTSGWSWNPRGNSPSASPTPMAGPSRRRGVWAVADFEPVGECVTDASGNAVLRAAATPTSGTCWRSRRGRGWTTTFSGRSRAPAKTDPYRLAHDYPGPLRFSLGGAVKVTVRVLDQRRVAARRRAVVRPWYFEMPKKGTTPISPASIPTGARPTSAAWRRSNCRRTTPRSSRSGQRLDGYHAPERCTWDPAVKPAEVTAKLRAANPPHRPGAGRRRPAGGRRDGPRERRQPADRRLPRAGHDEARRHVRPRREP